MGTPIAQNGGAATGTVLMTPSSPMVDPTPDTDQDISVLQCERVKRVPDARVRCRVLRGDTTLGEFFLVRGDDGWLPLPEPGATHEGLVHATAIDFARDVNEGRVTLD